MGFLHQFFQNVFEQSPAYRDTYSNSFVDSKLDEIEAHLEIDRYGSFQLTDAVRPSMDLRIRPLQGYRHDTYHDEESGADVPVLMAAASRETLFSLFMQLIQRLGNCVDVVLESSHDHQTNGHVDYYREHIDTPVLTSTLWEYEDLILNDGCCGIATLNPNTPQEVQFDEHKLLIIYGSPLEPFEHILERNGVPCQDEMKFITEADHVHTSTENFRVQFEHLRTDLGIDADHGTTNYC